MISASLPPSASEGQGDTNFSEMSFEGSDLTTVSPGLLHNDVRVP